MKFKDLDSRERDNHEQTGGGGFGSGGEPDSTLARSRASHEVLMSAGDEIYNSATKGDADKFLRSGVQRGGQ